MTAKPSKTNPWREPNADKYDFEERARELERADGFAQLDRRGLGLRGFLEQELQSRAATSSTATSLTLVPGRIYLRQLPGGSWELLVYRQRSCYDCYVGETAEEMLQLAEELQQGR